MLFALLVERWCLIKGFRIAGQVCGVFICSQWIPLTNKAKLWCLLSCFSERALEQTEDMQVSRKLMKLRLCYCDVICHSVIDDIIVPVCRETTGHQWITVARVTGWNFGGPVCGESIAGGFPSQKVGLMFSFMFAFTICLPNNRVAIELKSQDAYAMSLLCVICQSDIPHGWTSG